MDDLVGAPCIAIWHRTLVWAADELVALGPDRLRNLKVAAGEHLAAILTTAFLGAPPSEIDMDGGVDLLYQFGEVGQSSGLRGHSLRSAFEVKSLPGRFREVNAVIDRRLAAGEEAKGLGVKVLAREAKDVVADARAWLLKAQSQLVSKTKGLWDCSRNIFVVIHPFDHFAVDSFRGPPLGPFLPKLLDLEEVDSVWLLWLPHALTVCLKAEQGWTDLIFTAMNADEEPAEDGLSPLQVAELRFLELSGHRRGSPYLFLISAARHAER